MTDYRPPIVSFPQSERDRLITVAHGHAQKISGMDPFAAQEYLKHKAAKAPVVIAIYPDPDAPPDHDGLSFAVIKGFRLIEKAVAGAPTNLEMMAIAFDDEQQAIAAERDIGDNPPPPDRDSELVRKEVEGTIAAMNRIAPDNTVPLRFTDGKLHGGPPGDGTGMMFPVLIGARGHLSKQQARHAGKLWRAATQQYPKAYFVLDFPGYGEDERPPWELAEVRRYICWWAHYAGMDDLDTADRFVGTRSLLAHSINYSDFRFLLRCGVFGEELRQQAEIGILPTYAGKA